MSTPDPSAACVVTVYPLTIPSHPMFQRQFAREVDADDYEVFWRRLGHCHIRREPVRIS